MRRPRRTDPRRIPFAFLAIPMAAAYDRLGEFSGCELALYLVVIRETFGRRDPETTRTLDKAQIPIGRFCDHVGCCPKTASTGLHSLEKKGFIAITGSN